MSLIDLLPDPKPPRKISIEAATKLHLEWIVGLELAFEAVVLRALKRALKPVTSKFTSLTAAAGEPFVSIDDINSIRTTWSQEVAKELLPLLGEVYMTGSQSTNLAVGAVSHEVPDVVGVGAQEWLALSQKRLDRIGDGAWLNMRNELLEGFQQGESIDDLAKRVRQTATLTAAQARTVARTEVIGASNAGSFAEARVMEVKVKTWLNTHDARTRPTHVRAGEQTVPMDEPFIVGGSRLRFPHDPLGPPSETINCRCTLVYDEQPLCVCSPGWVRNELKSVTAAGQPDCGCSDDLPQLQTETDPKLPPPVHAPLHDEALPRSTSPEEVEVSEQRKEEHRKKVEEGEEEVKEKEEEKEEREEKSEERKEHKEEREEKRKEKEEKRLEAEDEAREEGEPVDSAWELGYESGYETGYEAGLEGEEEDTTGAIEESHDAENEEHFINGYEKGYASGYESGLKDREAEAAAETSDESFDAIGILTSDDVIGFVSLGQREFHLAGKHDQRKHGKGGPIGSTMEKYTDADGNWTPDRQKLHDEIVAGAFVGSHPVDHPTVTFFGGGPASGKSSVMKVDDNNVVVDADEIKGKLPEYQDMLKHGDTRAAAFNHEESSYLSSRVMNEGLAGGYNITMDGTGDSSIGKLRGKVSRARAAGAGVNAKYVTVDTDEAVRRANLRGKETGRVVPESVIRETHANVSRTFNDAINEDLFDSVQLWDNNGKTPKLIGEKPSGGKWSVNDESAWRSFLAKGGL